MDGTRRDARLRAALVATGLIFTFGIVVLMRVWPSGFRWSPSQPEYEQMIQGVYATLGVFLLVAARAPREHRSLVLFAGWSSLVHAGIMGVQALHDGAERGHLVGDVPALAVIGVVLLVLAPTRSEGAMRSPERMEARPGRAEQAVG